MSGPFPSRGTGLGLAICKEIISHYNGDINVESFNGKGSTFTFRIPLESSCALGSSYQTPSL